jgi:hypothetical protein
MLMTSHCCVSTLKIHYDLSALLSAGKTKNKDDEAIGTFSQQIAPLGHSKDHIQEIIVR